MEHTFDSSDSSSISSDAPWGFRNADREDVSSVLIVEDDADIREMLATLLDLAGFACVVCDSAEAGLAALRDRPVDLILTDYGLPEHTGVWLLERAEKEGLIQGTPVMIVTAHPDPHGAGTYEIVQKPFDLDDLVNRVRQRMEENGPRRGAPRSTRSQQNGGTPQGGGQRDSECPEPVELILYVSSQSVGSAAAIRNIEKVLSRFNASRVKLTVCDLSVHPAKGAEHSVAFTPTPVRQSPAPRTCILGHITNPELVLELLSECELDGQ
jgi:CheY-like chemotaxis protein